ncbi:thiocillin family RiPP [Streptococcus suis]
MLDELYLDDIFLEEQVELDSVAAGTASLSTVSTVNCASSFMTCAGSASTASTVGCLG